MIAQPSQAEPSLLVPGHCMDAQFLQEVDALHEQHLWSQAYEKMKPFVDECCANTAELDYDCQMCLRWARTLFNYAKYELPAGSRKAVFEEALPFAEKAINAGVSEGHLWYAALCDAAAERDGHRARLEASKSVRQHLEKAAELLPDNAHAQHALGKFYFEIADLSWIVRSIATLVFGEDSLPECTYEMALQQFLKAEQLSPDFYSMNTLHIAKCYMKLKQPEQAIGYYEKASRWQVKFADDEEARQDAVVHLHKLASAEDDDGDHDV